MFVQCLTMTDTGFRQHSCSQWHVMTLTISGMPQSIRYSAAPGRFCRMLHHRSAPCRSVPYANMDHSAETTRNALPEALTRSRQIRRAGIGLSAGMLLAGGGAAAVSGLLAPPPVYLIQAGTAIAAALPVALAGAKAVLGDSLHVEWHDGRLHIEQAVVDHAAGRAEVEVLPTANGRGSGAFAAAAIAQGAFLAEYEGELLSEAQYWQRYPSGVSDYCIRIDSEWTIDGAERATDTTTFSACHMNHAAGAASNVARLTFRREQSVRFYAKRGIQVGEELLLDYGKVYWTGRQHLVI